MITQNDVVEWPFVGYKQIAKELHNTDKSTFTELIDLCCFDHPQANVCDLLINIIDTNNIRVTKTNITKSKSKKYLSCLQVVSKSNAISCALPNKIIQDVVESLEHMKKMIRCDEAIWIPFHASRDWVRKRSSVAESNFRTHAETMLGMSLPSCRPSWLVNFITGNEMELDMFNEDQRIAIEYNGDHHYEYPNNYHYTVGKFIEQVYRDRLKVRLCKAMGIKLVVIKANHDVANELAQLEQLKISLPS